MEKQVSTHAAAAKQIRQFLKAHGVAGTVRSESYAGGNSVNVGLVDLPPALVSTIETFAQQFRQGRFDGMTDCYEYTNSNSALPQVKYVFVNVEFSADAKQAAWDFLRGYCAGAEEMPALYADLRHEQIWNEHATSQVYRFLRGSMFGLEAKTASFWNASTQAVVA